MAEAQAAPTITEINVPITKGKTTMRLVLADIPDDVYQEMLLQGAKVLLNRGASKITKETYPNKDELASAAVAKATEQLELVKTSKIKFTGGKKKSGTTGVVMTEARRLAKALVKDELKRQGLKVSHIEPKEITKYANAFLETEKGATLIEQAKANLAEREKVSIGDALDVKSIHISPELVKKAEAKRAKGGTLSAKQAGKVKTRAKGDQPAMTH